jgi:hypothetical protein
MARPRKIKPLQQDSKKEVTMSDAEQLETLETEIDKARLELEKTKIEIEERKHELKSMSARVIDADEQALIDKQISRRTKDKATEDMMAKQKEYDNVKVTGKFINRRAPGQPVKLPYIKYADDPVKWWPFEDGKVYTIPRGFADQINEHYYIPQFVKKEGIQEHSHTIGDNSAIADVDTSNKKYSFVPVNF